MAPALRTTLLTLAGLVVFVFAAGPVFLALVGSLVPDRVLFHPDRTLLEEGLSFDNYRYIFTGELPAAYLMEGANRAMISDAARQVPRAMWNSVVIAGSVLALNLLLGAPAAYAYARFFFPGKKVTFLFIILSPLVPAAAIITPYYMTVEALGLLGSKLGVILVHTARSLPFTVLILAFFFRKLPPEIFDSARIDGCTRFQAFIHCALPLSMPPICATGLFAFMLSYAEFLFSLVLSGEAASRPLSVVMAALARNTDVSWSLLNASIFIAILPTLALVVVIWRWIVEGLFVGATRG